MIASWGCGIIIALLLAVIGALCLILAACLSYVRALIHQIEDCRRLLTKQRGIDVVI